MKTAIAVLSILGMTGCATTNPETAAGISYRLPRTDARITLGIDVKSCIPDLVAVPTIKVDAVAGVQDQLWYIAGRDLASGVTKRGLTIDVDDNGVVTSVNASATDQQTVILGNLVKLAATVAPFAARERVTPVLQCNTAANDNIKRVEVLQSDIENAKRRLLTDTNPAAVQKKIDALATQLVVAKKALHEETTATLKLETSLKRAAATDSAGAVLEFDWEVLGRLFDTAYVGPNAPKQVTGVNKDAQEFFRISAYFTDLTSTNGLGGTLQSSQGQCEQWMTLPAARIVNLILEPTGKFVTGGVAGTGSKVVAQKVPASQLGDNARLCLSAGFGENRTVGLKFDKFGRTTEFAWTADARAANATSALAGLAPDASTVITTLQGRSLTADKAELDRLTTEQALARARACQALLDAGAASCPGN